MSMIHFVGGEKGGVGKSVFARLLSQYFIDRSLPHLGLDADSSHASLSRYYSDFTRPVDLDHFEGSDRIMELALETDRQVLVDLPAQSERFLDRWLEENDVLGMCSEMGVGLVYWYLVDDGRESAALLAKFLDKYAARLQCAVIRNLGCGSDFAEVDGVLEAIGEAPIPVYQASLPALHGPTMHHIDKLDFSFWAAGHLKEGDQGYLSLMERQRTRVWLTRAQGIIDGLLRSAD